MSILRVFRRMRHGDLDEQELEDELQPRGLINRFYGRATRAIRKPWQMYPLGVLFGLGFDTATEVALLVLAGGAAASGLPFYAIICLPILFAAGMSLFDTIDGAFMNFAYGWAFSKPIRKVFYNLTVTGLSVAVALLIGTIELLAVLAEKLEPHRRAVGLRRRHRPQQRRLHRRRPVRGDVGGRARRLALRPHRGALGRGRAAAVTTAPERRPLAFAGVDEMLATLREAGHRVSAPATLVIEALFAAEGPVSAEALASAGLERTSVYRNLERLEALGVVSHVHVGHGPGLYALVRGADSEYLTCDGCGRITTLDPAALDGVRAALHRSSATTRASATSRSTGPAGAARTRRSGNEHGAHAHPRTRTERANLLL